MMGTIACDNLRCQARFAAGARFCPRCGTGVAGGGWRPLQRRRRRMFRIPFILVLVGFSVLMRAMHHVPQPTAPPSAPAMAPSVDPPGPAEAAPPLATSASDGPPPFEVVLGSSLRRFEIERVGWRASAATWGTPAVLWADLRPVRASADRRMPGILLAWCSGQDATQIKRVTAEWGTDSAGPVLHALVDFNGLEHPFTRLELGAE